jgi:hypothetical protein
MDGQEDQPDGRPGYFIDDRDIVIGFNRASLDELLNQKNEPRR